jgi:peptidoglycan/LPS O-acetylase OafA/YrhL
MNAAKGHHGAEAGHNGWLDLVRAIAIVLVLVRHGYRASAASQEAAPAFLHALFMNGWVGVDLFFVLSGYLISRQLMRHGLEGGRFVPWRYFAMRALRIVPAYLAVMALILVSAFPFYAVDPDHLGVRVAYHLLFLQDYLPANINIVFWSLGVEEKFYLAAPLLVWWALMQRGLARKLSLLAAIAALSPALRALTYFSHVGALDYAHFFQILRGPFHACLEPLLVGVAIAVAQHAGAVTASPRAGARLFVGAVILLAAWLASHDFMGAIGAFDAIWQPVVNAGLCGLVTLGAVRLQGVPLPCERPVRAIARLSYSLYLVHYPLLPLALTAAGGAYAAASFWSVYLAAALAAAAALYWAVEKPFLRIKDDLARRRDTAMPLSPRLTPT